MIGALIISFAVAAPQGPKISKHGHSLERKHAGAGMGLHNNPKVRTIVDGDDPETQTHTLEINRVGRPHTQHSLWHDVSLKPMHGLHVKGMKEKYFLHFVCEMPKGTSAIMEVNKTGELNPIQQARDEDGKPMYITYKREEGIPFNYGIIPQTWEHPDLFDTKTTDVKGDDNPVDIIQVNEQPCEIGEVQRIRTIGAFAVKNHEHHDWKILVENVDDPDKSDHKHAKEDMHPDHLAEIVEWFKKYPTGEGHPEAEITFEGEIHHPDMAHEIIMEDHRHWKEMVFPTVHAPPLTGGDPGMGMGGMGGYGMQGMQGGMQGMQGGRYGMMGGYGMQGGRYGTGGYGMQGGRYGGGRYGMGMSTYGSGYAMNGNMGRDPNGY